MTEVFLKIDDGFGVLLKTELIKIDLMDLSKKTISSIDDGYVFPVKIENGSIVYYKEKLHQSVKYEYEQKIKNKS